MHFEHFHVAHRGDLLVGTAGLEPDGAVALLRSVAVVPSARGSGLGMALVQCVLEAARSLGVLEVYLLTTTAAQFFERLGVEHVGRDALPTALFASAELEGSCPESAEALHRRLGQCGPDDRGRLPR